MRVVILVVLLSLYRQFYEKGRSKVILKAKG
jgi:hypothetical protein